MRRVKQYLTSFVMLTLVLAGCSAQPTAVEEQKEEAPIPVQVESLTEGSVGVAAGLTGTLAPGKTVQVAPKVSGKIQTLNVELGQKVSQGDVLFKLDQQDLMNSVQQAEAAYKLALANFKQSDTSSAQGVEQAKNSLTQAEQALKDAKLNEQRMNQLFSQGAISQQQYEQAKSAVTNAQTAYDNAKATYDAAQKQVGIGVSQASVDQARVSLENAREQLANSTVTAPISGVVSSVSGSVGEMASPQMPVVVLVTTDPLLVKVNVSEQEITTLQVGSKVTVHLPALDKELEASVTAISPVMDQQVKGYPVEISIPNPTGELKSDMVANVQLSDGTENAKTLVVSRTAVFDQDGKRYAYIVEGDQAKQVEVTTGAESSDKIEILSGLNKGDQVVVKGQTMLKDGAKVKIQQTDK
ncbi:efflux RND transporter periplasmic adaptor subunit [Brevibacillus humidisoli]|uniref:efflux RND transporter periplasmic adaptor subunit n=1 Tax=Brevibacillus humidisoli TaxID=2895522 RepID=UPI001E4E9F86|nr:efflux RND transporter periplasmic adaptor subunit [Brevibacillus humidisoli]UFJ39339.1 efflux RND transporter periplasmic adaptor subunit [Brevibacillus humidisoli]